MLSLSEILNHFSPAKRHGKEYRTVCPAHDDHDPSLDISEGQTGIVFCCRSANCRVSDILAAAHLTWRDVLSANGQLSPTLIYTATFTDEAGVPLYDSLRYHPKDFKVKAASGAWSITGIRRVLYRLPELEGRQVVCYVEGPQKADALWRLGIPATCHIGGAQAWSRWARDYLTQLQWAGIDRIACLPDHDGPGREMSQQQLRDFQGIGLAGKFVELPNLPLKGDVLDFLAAGGTKDQILEAIKQAPIWKPSATPPSDVFETLGPGAYRWMLSIGITFDFDYVRREHHELHGELAVRTTLAGARVIDGNVLHIASFNASSSSTREARARLLAKRSATTEDDIDWMGLLETFCRRVSDAERGTLQVVSLAELSPAPRGDDARWIVAGIPILKHHPMLLYGDGGLAKSYLALYIAGCLAYEGVRVLYADWEFEGREHRSRLAELFGDGQLPQVEYTRCRSSIFELGRHLGREIALRRCQYLICDSVGAAADFQDYSLNDSTTANTYYTLVESLAPELGSFHTAHVSRDAQGKRDEIPQNPFGSRFWKNRARAAWYIRKEREQKNPLELGLYNTKYSTGPELPPAGLTIEFRADGIRLIPTTVHENPAIARAAPLETRIWEVLTTDGPKSYVELGQATGASPDTVARTMRRAKWKYRLIKCADGVQRHGPATDEAESLLG